MSTEKLENFIDIILWNYTPDSKIWADYEMKHNIHQFKAAQLQSKIMAFPIAINLSTKKKIAAIAITKLMDCYKSVSIKSDLTSAN